MDKQQNDQYAMLLSVENHMNDNTGAYSPTHPAIVASKSLLSTKITQLQSEVNKQMLATSGVTEEKNAARLALEDKAFFISGVASGYASANNLMPLYERVRFNRSDFSIMNDQEILGACTTLYTQVNPVAALLGPSVTAAVLTAFNTQITSFAQVMKNPREAVSARALATANIKKMLPDIINNVLERRLDNDVIALSISNPDFVGIYNNVRAIDSSPTTSLSLTITCLNQDGSPLANVDINIDGGAVTRISSARGYNTVLNLAEGSHSLTASKPGYADVTLSFVTVAEETLELLVTMHTI